MKNKDTYKWTMLALLWVTYFLQQGTRQIYNAVLPQIKADFSQLGVTDVQLGMIGTVFALVYGLSVPLAGIAADLLHRKWVIVIGTLLFSIGIFTSGFAASLGLLLVMYGILNGIGQCMVPSPSTSLIAQLHSETRSTALSIYQMALYAGLIVCSCVSGWLSGLGSGGWRLAFKIFGAAGIVWFVVLALMLRNTPPADGNVAAGSPAPTPRPSFKKAILAMISKPSAVFLTVAFGMCLYGANGFKTWMTVYLHNAFPSLTPAAAAFHAVFWFYAGAIIGIAVASRISDRLALIRPGIRMEMNIIGLAVCAPFVFLAVRMPGIPLCCVALALYGFSHGIYDSNLFASLYDVVEPRYRAAATGLFCCGAFILGAFAPTVLGWMSQHFSMKAGFSSLAVFYLSGAALILCARLFFLKRDYVQERK